MNVPKTSVLSVMPEDMRSQKDAVFYPEGRVGDVLFRTVEITTRNEEWEKASGRCLALLHGSDEGGCKTVGGGN
jgi:hypothetical protein